MTEQEAKMLAAELDQHRYWRVKKVCFNPKPYPRAIFGSGDKVIGFQPRQPGWEVWLELRTWPGCGECHCFRDFPVEYPTETVTALIESGKRLERWHQELATARIAR